MIILKHNYVKAVPAIAPFASKQLCVSKPLSEMEGNISPMSLSQRAISARGEKKEATTSLNYPMNTTQFIQW